MESRAVGSGAVLAAALLAGCTASSPSRAEVSQAPVLTPLQVTDVCPSNLDTGGSSGLKEIRGEAPRGESLYGLLFANYPVKGH